MESVARAETTGATLRRLRTASGLGLAEAARGAGLGKGTVGNWEADRRSPGGAGLDRLLRVLDAPARERVRLLASADPGYARITLARSPFGAPVDLGTVLRAIRERRGLTQAELAARVGVTQGAVAKWESGDSVPAPETVHAVGFALGLGAEETLALASARGEGHAGIPDDPEAAHVGLGQQLWPHAPEGRALVSLAWEAEAWRRAARDPRWEPLLAYVLASRANQCVFDECWGEIPALARRALRLATTIEGRLAAVPALGALSELARRQGGDPARVAEGARTWAERIPPGALRAWTMRTEATALATMGRGDEAEALAARSRDMDDRHGETRNMTPSDAWIKRTGSLAETLLAAGHPGRAADAIGGRREAKFDQLLYVRVEHANGRAVTGADMAYLRCWTSWTPYRHRRNLRLRARIERGQPRLTGGEPVLVPRPRDLPFATAEESARLWSRVPGGSAAPLPIGG